MHTVLRAGGAAFTGTCVPTLLCFELFVGTRREGQGVAGWGWVGGGRSKIEQKCTRAVLIDQTTYYLVYMYVPNRAKIALDIV